MKNQRTFIANMTFRRAAVGLVLLLVLLALPLAVFADNVQNDVVAGGNDTFVAGGSTNINYRIAANSGDGETGCNATAASPATVTINAPPDVTTAPASLVFTTCGTDQGVNFSSITPGNYEITVSVSDSGPGTYNTNPAKFTLHVLSATTDTTPPVIASNVSGTLGSNGWYTSDVTVSWSVVDNESDISYSSGCETTMIDSDTLGVTLTCEATSEGGTNSQAVTIKRDATPPAVNVTGVAANGQYVLGSVPSAGCDTTDATSGVATPASLAISGGNANGVGAFTATCSGATDNAGNAAGPASVNYSVIYAWDGFFQPVDNNALNVTKAGSAIPVKFSLTGYQGMNIFAAGYPRSVAISCSTEQVADTIEETVTAGQSSLNYDATSDQYNYVWKTDKAWATTCRRLEVKLNDGTLHTANFQFKK